MSKKTRLAAGIVRMHRWAGVAVAIVVTCFGLIACGGARDAKKRLHTANRNAYTRAGLQEREEIKAVQQEAISGLALPRRIGPGRVLARVQGKSITFAAVFHQMRINSASTPLPDPPGYTKCIGRLRVQSTNAGRAGRSSALPGAGEVRAGEGKAQLEGACEAAYKHALQSALSSLIHTRWLLGEAAEEGVRVSEAAVRRELELSKGSFRTRTEFHDYLSQSGQSLADMTFQIKLSKVVDGLSRGIEKRVHAPTDAEVAGYYDAHRAKYTIPQGRALRILRTTTQASAQRARREIEAGRSFASVAKELSAIAQPLGARRGEVADLIPGFYQERSLNDAIFSAPLHKLSGPVLVIGAQPLMARESGSGSYVFEVRRIVPARAIALSQVKRTIAAELARARRESTLRRAVAAFKAKWRARTTCMPGFVVKNCKQYKASPRAEAGDPFTL